MKWQDTAENYKLGFKLIEFLIWALSRLFNWFVPQFLQCDHPGCHLVSLNYWLRNTHEFLLLHMLSGSIKRVQWVQITNKIVKSYTVAFLNFFSKLPNIGGGECEHFYSKSGCKIPGLPDRSHRRFLQRGVLIPGGPDSIYIVNNPFWIWL